MVHVYGLVLQRRRLRNRAGNLVHRQDRRVRLVIENSCYWKDGAKEAEREDISGEGKVRIRRAGVGGWGWSGEYLCLSGIRAWPGSPCAHSPGHTGPASPPLPHTALQTHAYSLQHNTHTHTHIYGQTHHKHRVYTEKDRQWSSSRPQRYEGDAFFSIFFSSSPWKGLFWGAQCCRLSFDPQPFNSCRTTSCLRSASVRSAQKVTLYRASISGCFLTRAVLKENISDVNWLSSLHGGRVADAMSSVKM